MARDRGGGRRRAATFARPGAALVPREGGRPVDLFVLTPPSSFHSRPPRARTGARLPPAVRPGSVRLPLPLRALAPAPDAPSPTLPLALDPSAGASLTATVASTPDGGATVSIAATGAAGRRLLLHWGVLDAARPGGWRLPPESARPVGTLAYKKRALQTPFVQGGRGGGDAATVSITLPPRERSSAAALVFVVKDETTGDWWAPPGGGNWEVALHEGAGAAVAATVPAPPDLVSAWSLTAWQASGCPASPPPAAASAAAAEVAELLADGVPPAALAAAAASAAAYASFWAARGGGAPADLPGDVVGVQAYLMWEAAGRPDGADFDGVARRALARRLRAGESLAELRAELVPGAEAPQAAAVVAPTAEPAAPPPPTPPSPTDALGAPAGDVPAVDPLALVKATASGRGGGSLPSLAPPPARGALAPLEDAAARDESILWHRTFALGGGYTMLATVAGGEGGRGSTLRVTTDLPDAATLHWGVRLAGSKGDWKPPPPAGLAAGAVLAAGGGAADTPLARDARAEAAATPPGGDRPRLAAATIALPPTVPATVIVFVVRADDGTRWWRDGGGNFVAPAAGAVDDAGASDTCSFDDELACDIVDVETRGGHMTLMHRFNRAAELLERELTRAAAPGADADAAAAALSTIFIWLRYSAARHLTWQRNYNTQPRLLGEAQGRLSRALAAAHGATRGEAAEWARAALATVGRGSGAQAVRDEILNIMHRHKIGEKAGTWMEEWHQKLHNNTTPDDVAICEAYIAFLDSGGDAGAYWGTLSDAGVTRARLEGFDRAIRCEPQDFPDKRAALAADFRNYLAILKGVHSGADLAAAAGAVGDALPAAARPHVGAVLAAGASGSALALAQHAVAARTAIAPVVTGDRDMLYLDLALEAAARSAAERAARAARAGAAALVAPLLANLALSLGDNEDACYALKAWQDAPASATAGHPATADAALRAAAAADRARRAVAAAADRTAARLEGRADALGAALGVPAWARALFAEEVVRGGPAFGASLALSAAEPALRAAARLSPWQVLSPGAATGVVRCVASLHDAADVDFPEPTVLVAARVSGEEDVPAGVVAVLAGDAPDVLSHLAVRARNGGVLLAASFGGAGLDDVRALEGRWVDAATSAAGDVTWAPAADPPAGGEGPGSASSSRSSSPAPPGPGANVVAPAWCGLWAVGMDAYADGVVGAKSRNLASLRGALPPWIGLPSSVTVPFGAFEACLALPENEAARAAHGAAVAALAAGVRGEAALSALAVARDAALGVSIPDALKADLEAAMAAAGIRPPSTPARWGAALTALRGVWASMYNERALLSMRKAGLPHGEERRGDEEGEARWGGHRARAGANLHPTPLSSDALRMAVLVQRVVPAAYAFVIHTRNPLTGDADDVFCELVVGLGEAIVSGAVPGTALAFAARKGALDAPRVLAYPSKGDGYFVPDSLIFRSDSNGEDLPGYAGAGLYDSITVDESVLRPVDYGGDRLLVDGAFRGALMTRVARAGAAVEAALGAAQDVEGCVDGDGNIVVVQTRPQV